MALINSLYLPKRIKDMKRNIIMLLFICLNLSILAQSPSFFNYQAVVRDNSGNPIVNQLVNVKLHIIFQSSTGSILYSEQHNQTTNSYGLLQLTAGLGSPLYGNFSSIDWSAGIYFLKVEISTNGGVSYVDMGTNQLLSVPYSNFSQLAQSVADSLWGRIGVNIYNVNSGKVGIGNQNPPAKLVVQGDVSMLDIEPLFEVKDKLGNTVFVVYPDSVRIFVNDDNSRANKGTFAVSGRNTSKNFTHNYFLVRPDSTRIYTGDDAAGFGVENIGTISSTSYLKLTPENYFIGANSGQILTTGLYNSTFGFKAGENLTSGFGNVFMGFEAGKANSTGYRNVFVGSGAGENNTIGLENNFIGFNAGRDNTIGDGNIFIGMYCGLFNTEGYYNTFMGRNAGFQNSLGNFNVFIGSSSGSNNTMGDYLTIIGPTANVADTNFNYSTAIGYAASITADHQVRIGTFSTTSIGGSVDWTVVSDKRFKNNIQENVPGLDFILKLKPVTYNLDAAKLSSHFNLPDSLRNKEIENQKSFELQTGFLAQDVEDIAKQIGYSFSGIDKPKNDKDIYGIRYAEFTVPLVKAVQEQNQMILQLQNQIKQLQEEIGALKSNK